MGERVAAVVQARVRSERLPRKVLADIAGCTQLERVIRRCRVSAAVDRVIVATTTNADDDAVVEEARRLHADVIRGDEQDVLSRYIAAIRTFDLERLLRITADNPLLDPGALDEVVGGSRSRQSDYLTIEGYPLGLGEVELVTSAALLRADREAPSDAPEREHCTRWILKNPAGFHIDTLQADSRLRRPDLRLTVDYPADLDLIRFIYESFAPRDEFDSLEVIALLDQNPQWARHNQDLSQRVPQ